MAAVTVNSLTHPEFRVHDWNPPAIRCGPLAYLWAPAGTITLLAGCPVSEGNEELVIFPLSGSVGLQPCFLPVDLEFKVANPVKSLLSPLAEYHCHSFRILVSL